jgi:Tol biopolymer transport system component
MSIALPPGEQITTQPAISPDGMTIAYTAGKSQSTSRLYLRRLDSATPRGRAERRGHLSVLFS